MWTEKNASRGAKKNGRPDIKYLTINFTASVFIFSYVANNAEREMTAVCLDGQYSTNNSSGQYFIRKKMIKEEWCEIFYFWLFHKLRYRFLLSPMAKEYGNVP
jgi:hypothetical protein